MAKPPVRKPKKKVCVFCQERISYVDYKDTGLLRKYISDRGKIRARRVTGNCTRHQRDVATAIDWLCNVLGFEEHLVVKAEDGSVRYGELTFGNGMIMRAVGSNRMIIAPPLVMAARRAPRRARNFPFTRSRCTYAP